MAKSYYGHVDQIFLCDGDAISLSTPKLLKILHKIKRTFPEIKEISTYASAKGTLDKSKEELVSLKQAGLTKAYLGVESGDDNLEILLKIHIREKQGKENIGKVCKYKMQFLDMLGLHFYIDIKGNSNYNYLKLNHNKNIWNSG